MEALKNQPPRTLRLEPDWALTIRYATNGYVLEWFEQLDGSDEWIRKHYYCVTGNDLDDEKDVAVQLAREVLDHFSVLGGVQITREPPKEEWTVGKVRKQIRELEAEIKRHEREEKARKKAVLKSRTIVRKKVTNEGTKAGQSLDSYALEEPPNPKSDPCGCDGEEWHERGPGCPKK